MRVYRGTTLMTDSGAVYDGAISGGRVGILQFGFFPVIYANLRVECREHVNMALAFDGIDDYVTLGDLTAMNMDVRWAHVSFHIAQIIRSQGNLNNVN